MTFLLESPGPSGSNLHVYRILRSRERVWLAQFICLSLNALSQAAGQPRKKEALPTWWVFWQQLAFMAHARRTPGDISWADSLPLSTGTW